jgi:DNA-binding CsgD family transcriptional regulator/tetratricopeptide (TPR) repeat protein
MWNTFAVGEVALGTPFVGRDDDLERLLVSLASLEETGARTVLISGDAGIGKTRLVKEFVDRAGEQGALVACGVCTPTEGGGLPYGPVVGVLRDLFRQLDESTSDAILLPVRQHLGLDEALVTHATARPGEMGKTHLFEVLLDCFVSLCDRSPIVLVFEDLHWADSASVEVIDFLVRNLDASPVLLLGTYRRDELDEEQTQKLLAELVRHRAVARLELVGLDRDATALLMSGILGSQPDWVLLEAVHSRSEGNPFFAEELTAARDATTLPSALREVIMIRIDRLSPSARHVAAVVATAGGSIDHRLLERVAELGPDQLDAAITEALGVHVLEIDERSRFRFRHALQCDAVDHALLPTERVRLHQRLAVTLTEHPQLRASGPGHAAVELAEHWWGAGEWEEALQTSVVAADAMVSLLAMREAYAQYERAIFAYGQLPSTGAPPAIDHVDLLLRAAEAAFLTGAPTRSVELAALALADVDESTDPRRAAACHTMIGRNAWSNLDPDGAFEAFDRAAQYLSNEEPSAELARVLAEQARALMLLARVEESEERCHEAISIARAVGARAPEGHALCTLGVCLASRDDFDGGLARIREALVIAEELGEPYDLNRVYTNLTAVLADAGYLEEAADIVFSGLADGERLVGIRLNGAGRNSAEALVRLGRWDEAEELLSNMDDHGVGSCPSNPQDVRATLDIRRGRLDLAAAYLMTEEAISNEAPTLQDRGAVHMARAELLLEQDKPGDAYVEVELGLMLGAGTGDKIFRPELAALGIRALADEYELARTRRRRFDTDKALRCAMALVEEAECLVSPPEEVAPTHRRRPLALVAWGRAEATRLREPDPDSWHLAATRWEEASEPYRVAYCRWREAEATLAAKGGRSRAAGASQVAWQTAREIGAVLLLARVENLAQRARITLTDAEASANDSPRLGVAEDLGLTPREVEVLAQLAHGRTDRQIAESLYISKKTASVHVSNILRKLDVTSRIDAGEIGQRVGLA